MAAVGPGRRGDRGAPEQGRVRASTRETLRQTQSSFQCPPSPPLLSLPAQTLWQWRGRRVEGEGAPHRLQWQEASEFQQVAWQGVGCQTDTVVVGPGGRGRGRETKGCHAEASVAEKTAAEGMGCGGDKGGVGESGWEIRLH